MSRERFNPFVPSLILTSLALLSSCAGGRDGDKDISQGTESNLATTSTLNLKPAKTGEVLSTAVEPTRLLVEPAVATIGELAPNVALTSISKEVKTINEIRAGKPLILVTLDTFRNDPKMDLRDELILKKKLDDQVVVAAVYLRSNPEIGLSEMPIFESNSEFEKRFVPRSPSAYFIDREGVLVERVDSLSLLDLEYRAVSLVERQFGQTTSGTLMPEEFVREYQSLTKLDDLVIEFSQLYNDFLKDYLTVQELSDLATFLYMAQEGDLNGAYFEGLIRGARALASAYCQNPDEKIRGFAGRLASAAKVTIEQAESQGQIGSGFWDRFSESLTLACQRHVILDELTPFEEADLWVKSQQARHSVADLNFENLAGQEEPLANFQGEATLLIFVDRTGLRFAADFANSEITPVLILVVVEDREEDIPQTFPVLSNPNAGYGLVYDTPDSALHVGVGGSVTFAVVDKQGRLATDKYILVGQKDLVPLILEQVARE